MTSDLNEAAEGQRPAFTHQRTRHGLIGPFSGRQLLVAALAVLVIAIVGVAVTTPLGNTANDPSLVDPLATPFLIGEAPAEGLTAGQQAPELTIDLDDGSTYQLTDLDGKLLGTTPLDWVQVEAGEHKLRVRHPSKGTWEETVRLSPGEKKRIAVDLASRR